MFFYAGLKCPVCNHTFGEGEDIVSCPTCGLPHHRSCWQSEGKCHLEHLHGTEEQWCREKAIKPPFFSVEEGASPSQHEGEPSQGQICPRCRTRNQEFAEYCAHCGHQLQITDWRTANQEQRRTYNEYQPFQSPFSYAESFSPEEWLGKHQAKELAAVVGNNAVYYIPRFRRILRTGSGGWNWAAFLFGPYWLLYRKSYLLGTLFVAVQTIFSFATNLLLMPIQTAKTNEEMLTALERLMGNEQYRWVFVPILILSTLMFLARLLLGIFGNRLYLLQCERRIFRMQQDGVTSSPAEMTSSGGVSVNAVIIAYFVPGILSYLLTIFQML